MRKILSLAVIAVLAVIATGCKNDPSSLKGKWVDKGIIEQDGYQIESVWTLTVTGTQDTNAPGTLTRFLGAEQLLDENVLVTYSRGQGTLVSADGSKHIEGTIKAEAKDELLINIDEDGSARLRNGHFFKED